MYDNLRSSSAAGQLPTLILQAHRTDQACLQRQPLGLSKKSADLASNLEGSQAEVQRIHKELSHSPPRLTSMKSQTAQLRQQLAQAKSLHSHVVKVAFQPQL